MVVASGQESPSLEAPKDAPVAVRRVKPAVSAVEVREVPLEQIEEDPGNARITFDADRIQARADSMREVGQLQPAIVRKVDGGKYRLVDGALRFRAAPLAGLKTLRCEVRDLDDVQAALAAATANLQRENLTEYEEARGFQHIMELSKQAGKALTMADVARLAGVAPNTVKNRLQLLKVPEEVGRRIGHDGFAIGHAQALTPYAQHPKLLEAALAFVDKEKPEAGEASRQILHALRQQGLVRTRSDVNDWYNLNSPEKAVAKVEHLDVGLGAHYQDVAVYTDPKAFDQAVLELRTAETARKAKAAAKAKEPEAKKELSIAIQARRGLRNVQADLMAEHVAKLDKWTDELQALLIQTALARMGTSGRAKDQELITAACGLTEQQQFAIEDDVALAMRKHAKELHRFLAARLFFANQDTKHELVGDKYEAVFVVEDPVAKLLTGHTMEKTTELLKGRIKGARAKSAKAKPAAKPTKEAPAKKTRVKARPAAKAKKDSPAVQKARAKLAKQAKLG